MQPGDVRTTDYTEEGAKKSFEFVLKDYLDYTVENGTLEQDLINHGWLYKAFGKAKLDVVTKKGLSPYIGETILKEVEYV